MFVKGFLDISSLLRGGSMAGLAVMLLSSLASDEQDSLVFWHGIAWLSGRLEKKTLLFWL